MRAVLLEVPEDMLERRRRLGLDGRDEVWEGVLHMVPPPLTGHQGLRARFLAILLPLAEARGLMAFYETGLRRPGSEWTNFRVPDLMVARPENVVDAAVEGPAVLAVEFLSPGDESYAKLAFFADLGVEAVLIIDPQRRAVELFVLRGGRLHAALPDADGVVRLASVGLDLSTADTVDGPRLALAWPEGAAEI